MKENPIQGKSGFNDLIDRKVYSIPPPGDEDLLRNFPSFKFLSGNVISDERENTLITDTPPPNNIPSDKIKTNQQRTSRQQDPSVMI